jgi:DNA-binding transcriptional LysR family regulator
MKALTTFIEVAKASSLSAVARDEGVTPAMVGRRIDQLEESLGVKLFKRSTRKITLTPEGASFRDDVTEVLNDLKAAESSLTVGARNASGRLIITAPTAFGRKHIAPHIPAFLQQNPNLDVTLMLTERVVDLKNEPVDLAIRIADMRNVDLVATKLARNRRCVVGSPDYLKRNGKPTAINELHFHRCLITSTEDGLADAWSFRDGNRNLTQRVSGVMHCNDGEVLTQWAKSGHGLAWRSSWEVSEDLDKGRLVEVLSKFAAPGNDIYAVYAGRKYQPAKVRLFIEFLKSTYGETPYWEKR